MTTTYFSELTDHTIEEAETLLKWANVSGYCTSLLGQYDRWHYGEANQLLLWLHEQTILAIRDGGGMVNESLSH